MAWEKIIKSGLDFGTKVVLLTPTHDLREDTLSDESELAKQSEQIRDLARKYHFGLADCYKF
ncbi:hypothetical protein [Echinicola sp. 20G]|uniref:hypothetical protein n=1 Tax=Echinicola sp. 20G TaxID=2781961 RepID=UPI0019107E36|nr:hypothetical protein [Echinicola sp. 20G]